MEMTNMSWIVHIKLFFSHFIGKTVKLVNHDNK